MNEEYGLLLEALRCALHGEQAAWKDVSLNALSNLMRLSHEHGIFAMVAEAIYNCPAVISQTAFRDRLVKEAKRLTIAQAQRTADFLLFCDFLSERGLEPIVTKGIMCRRIYPKPDQRVSVDEDLLIGEGEYERYYEALCEFGMTPAEPEAISPNSFEISFIDKEKHLYIEVHKSFFEPLSDAYGDCNAPFVNARAESRSVLVDGRAIRTLAPTDHLLYLILHAYKHFLHGGVGIRQVSDICMFHARYKDEIDAKRIRRECEKLNLLRFTAALFGIGSKKLGIEPCGELSDECVDFEHLLFDILSGGLYGVTDINRAHSSTLTIEAASANKTGRRRRGVLSAVFLPKRSLESRYSYLKKHPWLLPAAWTQRAWSYLTKRDHGRISPSESLRIGRERIALMKEYGMIDD